MHKKLTLDELKHIWGGKLIKFVHRNCTSYKRNYILALVSSASSEIFGSRSIMTFAMIDMDNRLRIEEECGCDEYTSISIPSASEYLDFIGALKGSNINFNIKTNTMIRVTDKHVFFWSGWPSNWYPSIFNAEYEGKEYTFHNAEQYFMFVKAKTFGDDVIAERIIREGEDPKIAKNLGRKVKNYNDKIWDEKRFQTMFDACYLKFTKCPKLREALLGKRYEGKGFVEGSPYDKIWGIGVHYSKASDDETEWEGQNLLGKVLDAVREKIKAEKQ